MTDDDAHLDPWLAELRRDPAPRDVVPGGGLTREDVLRMNAATGTIREGTVPGRVLIDVDGIPTAVEPSRTIRSYFGGIGLTRAQLAALDLTPEDVPNVYILNPRKADR